MTDHAELRRLAKAATPGPWSCNRHWAIVGGPTLEFTNGAAQQQIAMACWQSWMHEEELRNNAAFIASANPKTILALLDEIDGMNDELSACTEHPGGCGYWREAAKRRAEERDRLKAENEALRESLQALIHISDATGWEDHTCGEIAKARAALEGAKP
ncbi:ead/Ea22-like family protein [Pseudomonas aeruginosa]|uniref:ead/Ea22-like family protein n=3 Tax=Pseudomonas aeruginosa TaxID=287 RepID=UPI00193D11BA|nr:ead/Ea22-like family protein [Pseudomonas aeruginosa]MBI8222291.1 ead/Ea22-like family protein [Pseudomonas aeruginosa]MDP5708292.1 ead/Ea22-like family protein [Pseudomonas aeruginosa]HBO0350720.1 ead/Ea22-like family protein [Pseudomonas aeruginosa]HCF2189350.1 ead/Ea22-like family protein [Pseudomonas aeruginosa]HCL4400187.1 ead/Ea22-like family protein [Pseudomonas aeruginosa]